MTVAELDNRMGSSEYQQWMEYLSAEPTLEERTDIQAATIATAIYRSVGAKVDINKFLPRYETDGLDREYPTQEELSDKLENIFGKFN